MVKTFWQHDKKKVRKFCVRRAKIPRKNHSKIANLTWRALSQLPLGIKPSLICENHQNVTFWLSGHGGFTKKKNGRRVEITLLFKLIRITFNYCKFIWINHRRFYRHKNSVVSMAMHVRPRKKKKVCLTNPHA